MTSTPGFPEVLGTAGDCQGMPVHMRFLKYSLSPHQTTSDPSALEMEVRELTNSFDPRCNVAILHRLFLHNDLHCQVIEHFFEDVLELPLLGRDIEALQDPKVLALVGFTIVVSAIFVNIRSTDASFIEGISKVPSITTGRYFVITNIQSNCVSRRLG